MPRLRTAVRYLSLRFGLGLPPSSGVREGLQWLMMARIGALYVVQLVIVLQQVFRSASGTSPTLYVGHALLALSFAFNLAQAVFLERLPPRWWLAALNILFDAAVTSTWILLTGAEGSLYALLYLIQILFVALIFYRRGAVFGAIVACLGFGAVTLMRPPENALLIWGIYSVLFVILGVVGGHLSEELLRTSRRMERLQHLHERIIARMPTGLLTVDGNLRIQYLNPAGEHILGWELGDGLGRELGEVEPGLLPFFTKIEAEDIAEDDEASEDPETTLSRARTEFHHTLFAHPRSRESVRLQQTVEIGTGRRLRVLRGDVADLDADVRVLLFQDVTKLLHLEDKLKQHEKLAAVGQLAAGIAHEIRNPLASLSGSIQMLRSGLPEGGGQAENRKLMDIAVREIDRLNNLISEFLDFVKPARFRLEKVPLQRLLADVVVALRNSRDLESRVRLVETYDPAATANANAEKLKQVVWNLLVNAVQAMDKPGRIEVGCAPAGGHRVKLWVEDEGQGMSEEVLAHLYEPFFTTKERGTGLGLATAYKIVEALHGEIRVKSKPNAGTRFEVYLQSA